MDKETLSHYGWVVILVLILAVLLALASPFGNFIAGAIKATTAGFFSVNQSALNSTGLINIGDQSFDDDGSGGVGDSGEQTPCEHAYESDVVVNCDTVGTITYTCSKCGDTYTEERTTAKHTFDDTSDEQCNVCNKKFANIGFNASTHDSKMGTTTATDAVVVIPETVAYKNSYGGTDYYKITGISNQAFMNCSSLETVVVPNAVTYVGDSAFWRCHSLKEINLPNGITSIGKSAFTQCYNLKTVLLPSSLTSLGDNAFNQSGIESIVIPHGVSTIGRYTFDSCSSLQSVVIPKSVISIGYNAFGSCRALTDITFEGTIEQWNAITLDNSWRSGSSVAVIHCSDGDINL